MPEIKVTFQRQRKYIFLLLSVYVLGWGFTPYQSIFGLDLWYKLESVQSVADITKGASVWRGSRER